jgi:hypothetical protein
MGDEMAKIGETRNAAFACVFTMKATKSKFGFYGAISFFRRRIERKEGRIELTQFETEKANDAISFGSESAVLSTTTRTVLLKQSSV